MSRTIFVVMGTSGEYSDRNEWAVEAFTTLEPAQVFINACTQEALRLKEKFKNTGYVMTDVLRAENRYDKNYRQEMFEPTAYFYYEVELRE